MAGMVKRADFLANEVVDLTEEIKLVSPTDTPLTTMLMSRGQVVPAKDITVTWREKELNSQRGTLRLEGAEAGDVITSNRGTLSNLCQIVEKVTQVSGTARALNPYGVGDAFDSEVNDRLIETKRDMEWYFLNGTKASESGATPRQMNGLVNLVNTENVIQTKGALTEDHFWRLYRKCGSMELKESILLLLVLLLSVLLTILLRTVLMYVLWAITDLCRMYLVLECRRL